MRIRSTITIASLLAIAAYTAIGQERSGSSRHHAESKNISRESANKIERALNAPYSTAFTDLPLRDALNKIEEDMQINIWPDTKVLSEDGISTDTTVTLVISGVSLRTVLRLILEPMLLTSVIEGGILKITTETVANDNMFTRVYPIPDLINKEDVRNSYIELMRSIQQSAPGKWEDTDGEGGRMSPVTIAESLVIRQTQKVHRVIEGVLTAVRKAKNLRRIPSIAADPDDVENLSGDTVPSLNSELSRTGPRSHPTTRRVN